MKKPINWDELKIDDSELDNLLDLDLLSTWAIELSRVFILHKSQYIKSLFATEASAFFLGLLLFVPLNLIFFRHWEFLQNNTNGFVLVLAIAILLSILILGFLNYYLWYRAKQIKSLAVILEKISDYNHLIAQLKFISKINNLNSSRSKENQFLDKNVNLSSEITTALKITKNSLIKSIELEEIIKQNKQIGSDRYQIFANLEENLIQVLSLADKNTNSEYQQLLTEVIQIGLSVHQELRKIQTLR
jgi:hypothetical protein